METFFVYIYCLPLWHISALILIFTFCWRWLVQKKVISTSGNMLFCLKILSVGCFLLWCAAIVWYTVLRREPGVPLAHWEPFFQLKAYFAGEDQELLRSLWMNVLLFVPGGFLLAAALPRRWRMLWLLLTFLALTSLSIAIEWKQFSDGLGLAETDDVLCNSLGAIIGMMIEEAGYRPVDKRSVSSEPKYR